MYTTDGSELAGKAVQHGVDLAKRISAKANVLTVLPPFHVLTTDTQVLEDTPAQYKARMQEHAARQPGEALGRDHRLLGLICGGGRTGAVAGESNISSS